MVVTCSLRLTQKAVRACCGRCCSAWFSAVIFGIVAKSRQSPPEPKPSPQPEPPKQKKKQPRVDITARKASVTSKADAAAQKQPSQPALASLPSHQDTVTGVAIAALRVTDGEGKEVAQLVASCSEDRTLRLTRVDQGVKPAIVSRLELKLDPGSACALSPDGSVLAVALSSGKVQIYRVTLKGDRPFMTPAGEFKTSHKVARCRGATKTVS